jgi:sugar/nucleoside kinase (ribokinase family)
VILCLGEALVDLVCERAVGSLSEADSFVPHFGGAMANVAIAARRRGAEAALAGGTGDDDWGRWLRDRLGEEGVDMRWFSLDGERGTPMAVVTVNVEGEPTFYVYGAGIEAGVLSVKPSLEQAVASCEALVFGSNTLVGDGERELTFEARRLAIEAGRRVLFDPNLRLHRWADPERALTLCRELCSGAYLVRTNRAEAELLTGASDAAAAEALCGLGARNAVVTRGPEGAVMRGEVEADVPGVEVEVVSTMGAGDTFLGTLVAGLAAASWDAGGAAEIMTAAVGEAAAACTRWGALA